jgi:hypothetical protein
MCVVAYLAESAIARTFCLALAPHHVALHADLTMLARLAQALMP